MPLPVTGLCAAIQWAQLHSTCHSKTNITLPMEVESDLHDCKILPLDWLGKSMVLSTPDQFITRDTHIVIHFFFHPSVWDSWLFRLLLQKAEKLLLLFWFFWLFRSEAEKLLFLFCFFCFSVCFCKAEKVLFLFWSFFFSFSFFFLSEKSHRLCTGVFWPPLWPLNKLRFC